MAKIKRPSLDECGFIKDSVDDGGNHPVVEPGIDITVRYRGLELNVNVNAFMKGDPNLFGGTITGLNFPPEGYDDLSIGDSIIFHKNNICSIP